MKFKPFIIATILSFFLLGIVCSLGCYIYESISQGVLAIGFIGGGEILRRGYKQAIIKAKREFIRNRFIKEMQELGYGVQDVR